MHSTCTKSLRSLVKVLCAAAVNTAMFISDHAHAVKVLKEPDNPTNTGTEEDKTMSLLWVCTGVTNLSKVRHPLRGCGREESSGCGKEESWGCGGEESWGRVGGSIPLTVDI